MTTDGTGMTQAPAPPMLHAPAEGLPDVVADERELTRAAEAVAAGTGPVALDAERASGYRYGQQAYLVQLRRAGAGTWLIDPLGVPDLTPLASAIGDAEWVLHAATQDIPCLAALGLRPSALFDTELGARLAGLPRVGLAAVMEHYLGVTLAKEHSAVDWSTRPLPANWLTYAALDVELLVELRDAMRADLADQGKLTWAEQEFSHLTAFTGPPGRVDPWRRTSGMHRIRSRRTAAILRELWLTRDALARDRDISPGRLVSDAHLVAIASAAPASAEALQQCLLDPAARARRTRGGTVNRGVARHASALLDAVSQGRALPEAELPPIALRSEGPPPPRAWADKNPVAAARLGQVREALASFSEERAVPVENVLTPDTLRRVIWAPPAGTGPGAALAAALDAALTASGARPWQREIVVPLLVSAFTDHPETGEDIG